jgi:hypothetical protein
MAHSTVEFWESNYHLKGTAGLLQVRKQQEYPQNLPLEKALRRAIVSGMFTFTLLYLSFILMDHGDNWFF